MRARVNLLSEIPVPWGEAVQRWSNLNERFRRGGVPDRNAEYLLYQTLVGAWPVSADRACACMEKSAREAKSHTDWTLPNPAYDDALRGFITGALENADFVADLERFVAPLIDPGFVNSLAQTLVKLTAPGVPDIYQGAERWDFNLVDPDNRRPVDFGLSDRLLSEAGFLCVDEIWRRRIEGLPKLWLISRVLNARRLRPECFSRSGTYEPLPAQGDRADHVVAFVRGGGVVTLVPRLVMAMKSDWRDTAITLPDGQWRNALTGENVTGGRPLIAPLLARFPVAFLLRASI
jgi:(1->4)-alpha-D-glucan 1-alpha-D-glucosylmutase